LINFFNKRYPELINRGSSSAKASTLSNNKSPKNIKVIYSLRSSDLRDLAFSYFKNVMLQNKRRNKFKFKRAAKEYVRLRNRAHKKANLPRRLTFDRLKEPGDVRLNKIERDKKIKERGLKIKKNVVERHKWAN